MAAAATNTGETSPEVAALAAKLMHHDDPEVRRVAASALRQVMVVDGVTDEEVRAEITRPDGILRYEEGEDPAKVLVRARALELDDLRRKLTSREGQPGFEQNVQAIKARIAELETAEGA